MVEQSIHSGLLAMNEMHEAGRKAGLVQQLEGSAQVGAVGAVGAKIVAFLAQYWIFRSIVRHKLRSGLQPQAHGSNP